MLDMFFAPKGIALVGASRDPSKLGFAILDNLVKYGYAGNLYPINPKATEVLGLTCYASITDIPGEVDLAVIVIPSKYVAPVLRECGEKGVKGAIIITAGFR